MHIIKQRTTQIWLIDSLIFALVIFVSCLYFWFNTPQDVVYVLKNGIDDLIPRLPIFTIPYLLFLPWFWLIVVYAYLSKNHFYQLSIAIIIVNLIAFVIYAFYQTHIIREPIIENDIFSQILAYIYANDKPYAGCPSLHSGLSAIVATYFVITKNKWMWAFVAMALLVVVSTLFTKQHYFVDALSGMSLGIFVTMIVFWFQKHCLIKNNPV